MSSQLMSVFDTDALSHVEMGDKADDTCTRPCLTLYFKFT